MENVIEVAKQYVKAFKEANPAIVEKYFLPQASKTGYFYDFENKKWNRRLTHSFQEISEWTQSYNQNDIMPNSEISATLLDMQDKIAVVKIVAEWAPNVWGYDYITLVKDGEEWRILAILWQSIIE